ncbi:MAG: DUF3050 domain-containing protein [Thiohalobacteraceae bacterium]
MSASITAESIAPQREALNRHPIYAAITDLDALRCFMEHHVFSVWDFMSLVKYLQNLIAPPACPWLPTRNTALRRFVNELVLEEESDVAPNEGGTPRFTSHFELYCAAMREVGACTGDVEAFVNRLYREDVDKALGQAPMSLPARRFTRTTFDFIASGKPHIVAAALALGREHIVPDMFRAILARTGVDAARAPSFHYYLDRHVHLDEELHAPLSLQLLNELCAGDPVKIAEATAAARAAVAARIAFWDGVHAAIVVHRAAAAV